MSNPILEGLHEIAQGKLYLCEYFWASVEPDTAKCQGIGKSVHDRSSLYRGSLKNNITKLEFAEALPQSGSSSTDSIHFSITGMKNIALNRSLRFLYIGILL